MSDVQSRETPPKLTPARREALKEAASEGGYQPIGASQNRMARALTKQGLLRRNAFRWHWRITDLGRELLEGSDAH